MSPTNDRQAVLNDGALAVGALWARTWREEMRKEGRVIAGGWPGTVPEARARVTAYFETELARRRMASISAAEVQWTVATTYQKAKRDWLARER